MSHLTSLALATSYHQKVATKASYSEHDLLREYTPSSLYKITDDPVKAKYFDEFMKDPVKRNAEYNRMRENARRTLGDAQFYERLYSNVHDDLKKERKFDFRLNDAELQKYKENGFVVSERMAVESFAEAYYRIYTDDMPVFVSADSILHAWHMSFSEMLKDIEADYMFPMLRKLCSGMHNALPEMENPSLSVKDADFFLSVTLSLLDNRRYSTKFHQDQMVGQTLSTIRRMETKQVQMSGEERIVDFSQFKPRGHYTSSSFLKQYFQAMMWLSRIDFRLCTGTDASRKQLELCVMLVYLLRKSGEEKTLLDFNRLLVTLIGETDSLDAGSLLDIIGDDIDLANPSKDDLDKIERALMNQPVGVQVIDSHIQHEDEEKPWSFAFVGQKFTLDAFVFCNVTFDHVFWKNEKVQRRRPSGLDVAFSVLGNDIATEEIVRRIKSDDTANRRDGKPYAHQLAALRQAIDELPEAYWGKSVYALWLNALRALSRVSTERTGKLFHSVAWGKRVMNAQLGSWSELKHDTVLYAKQSYGCMTLCEYPEGIVEPVPEFFQRMAIMSETVKTLLAEAAIYNSPSQSNRRVWKCSPQQAHFSFLDRFSNIMYKLQEICTLQQDKKTLPDEMKEFLGNVMEERHGSGETRYLGWYPKLFYGGGETSGNFEPRIADVFTAPRDHLTSDTGGVLHVGVGKVLMGILAVNGIAYAGPVFSYYEFETAVDKRLDDKTWKEMVRLGEGPDMPALTEWATESFICTR